MNRFEKLMFDVAKGYEPARDYSKRKNEDLIFDLVVLLAWARESVTRITYKAGDELNQVYKQASQKADNLAPDVLEQLYSIYADERPLRFLVWVWVEKECIYEEIRKRVEKHKVGGEFLRLRGRKAREPIEGNSLLTVLRVERLTSYYPWEESNEELRDGALQKALEYQKDTEGKALDFDLPNEISCPLPPNTGLPAEQPPWDRLNPRLRSAELKRLAEILLPVLQGTMEKLPEKVRLSLRDRWKKRKAKKREAPERVSLKRAEKEAVTSPWETSSGVVSYLDAARAYKVAERRYGDKGRRFLDALIEHGGDVTKASKEAGFSRQMGHRYLVEIRKELTKAPTRRKK